MFYQNRLYTKNARNAAKLASKVEINIRNNPIPHTCWGVRNVIGDATENKMVLTPQTKVINILSTSQNVKGTAFLFG